MIRSFTKWACLALALLLPARAHAADAPAPSTATAALPSCATRPADGVRDEGFRLQVAPETQWRPRGAEVEFAVLPSPGANDATDRVTGVAVRFHWSPDPQIQYNLEGQQLIQSVEPAEVRSFVDADGHAKYAATVPMLRNHGGVFLRLFRPGIVATTGFGTVPLAVMEVAVEHAHAGQPAACPVWLSADIGVTDVYEAVIVTSAAAVLVAALLLRIAGLHPEMPGSTALQRLVSMPDGYVNLTQWQVVLWTAVVFTGVIYVLCLSGTLVGITKTSLALLGIQATTTGVVRVTHSFEAPPHGALRTPRWTDLVLTGEQPPYFDIAKLQAVIATLIVAAYVSATLLADYQIPDVPFGYLALMGISNGIYVATDLTRLKGRKAAKQG